MARYTCSQCGEVHEDLADVGIAQPDYYWGVPEVERRRRIELDEDICILDGEDFFIRGVIEIPIHDYTQKFGFGVWVSQKKENFQTYREHFDSSAIGPFFGWLSNQIIYYEADTINLKTMVHFRGGGLRPIIELDFDEHPLSVAQRDGITLEEAWKIVHFYDES